MTDNEIIEWAEKCIGTNLPCISCPFDEDTNTTDECMGKLVEKLIEVSNRQKAEIERLNAVSEICGECHKKYAAKIETAKSEAIKEFAEIVYRFFCNTQNWKTFKEQWLENGECYWLKEKLNNLVK